MIKAEQRGFTLVEVILFLALSGLFFGIAFMGIRQRSNNIQFTDSMRSLQSFIQRQQNEVYNGVNTRGSDIGCVYGGASSDLVTVGSGAIHTSPGQSENCLLVGKVLHFSANSSEIEVYPIVGKFLRQTVPDGSPYYLDADQSNAEIIVNDLKAWILHSDDFKTTYSAKWGAEFRQSNTFTSMYWLGFIRSPATGGIFPFSISNDVINMDKIPLFFNVSPNYLSPLPTTETEAVNYLNNIDASYCMEGVNGQAAQLNIGVNGSGDVVELEFDSGCI